MEETKDRKIRTRFVALVPFSILAIVFAATPVQAVGDVVEYSFHFYVEGVAVGEVAIGLVDQVPFYRMQAVVQYTYESWGHRYCGEPQGHSSELLNVQGSVKGNYQKIDGLGTGSWVVPPVPIVFVGDGGIDPITPVAPGPYFGQVALTLGGKWITPELDVLSMSFNGEGIAAGYYSLDVSGCPPVGGTLCVIPMVPCNDD